MDRPALFVLAVVLLSDTAWGHDCLLNCDPETGLRRETLFATTFSYEGLSQCADPTHCDDSTPGTGHKLSSNLTEDLIAVERCYSFCYTNVTGGIPEGNATLVNNIYAESACSEKWKEGHVCFATCLFGLELLLSSIEDIADLISEPNTTCSDFCTIPGGICERAFPPDVGNDCIEQCRLETCPGYCRLVEDNFPSQSTAALAVTYPSAANKMPKLTMDYTSNVTLKKEGVLEVQVNYVPPPPPSTSVHTTPTTTRFTLPPGVTLPPGLTLPPPPPTPSSLPSGVAYGLIWKVTYSERGQMLTRYISQHLPFLLLPDEVGPLYRIGSNMLAIRDLQCKKNMQLSFAIVNVHGIGPFTTMETKCLYGSWFPIPPNDVTVKLGFDYSTGELQLEITSSDLSPDQEYVEGYRVQIVSAARTPGCIAKLGRGFTILNDVAFDNKDNLTMVVRGTEAVEKFFPVIDQRCNFLIGVYALPQRNVSATGRPLFAVANWKSVFVDLPDYAMMRGNTTFAVSTNPITGLSDVTYTYTVSSHWSSLAVVKTVYGQLTKELTTGDTVLDSLQLYFTDTISIMPNMTMHYFQFHGVQPTKENEVYKFQRIYMFRYEGPFFNRFDNPTFPLPPGTPSPVRNLIANVSFDRNQGKIIANLSWIGSERPYGKIDHYKIVLSSTRAASLIGSKTLDVQNTAAAQNMNVPVRTHIVSDLLEDEYFNFSVRAVSKWGAVGEWAVETVVQELTPPPPPMDRPVIIVNLQDITTQNDLQDNNAVFTFDVLPRISPNVTLGYRVQIHWRQVRMEFGGYHGTDTYYLPPKRMICGHTPNTSLELVGAGSFKLTVPTSALKPGPLSLSVSISLVCLQRTFYCHICTKWSYISQMSNTIEISAKRGSLAPFEVDLKLWPKEQCFEAADAIKATDVTTSLIKAIRANADNIADTSLLQVYGERYLCERKGYLSFRGVLVKRYDFLATKNRDVLHHWLEGGARHIVVADRWMNIKEGACGIALTSLEDPACGKRAGKKG